MGCTENGAVGRGTGDVVSVTLIQMNDVYEITPVAGGKEGGLARVATLRKQLLSQNANTVTILAGDLLKSVGTGNGDRGWSAPSWQTNGRRHELGRARLRNLR